VSADLGLLSGSERDVLRAISEMGGMDCTPQRVATWLGKRGWQSVTHPAGELAQMGFIRIRRLPNSQYPKMTLYSLSPLGERVAAELATVDRTPASG
jgi:DNA-binding MarR family transcriptional regulator